MTIYDNVLSVEDKKSVEDSLSYYKNKYSSHIGYQLNHIFDYSELFPFLNFNLNNCGDPYKQINYYMNTKKYEQEVIDFFSEVTNFSKNNSWGYITSGGSESNLYGLFLARELLPDAIVYHSEDIHYSISKAIKLLKLKSIEIRSQKNGEIDYDALKTSINPHKDKSVIILANIGTTMTGAIDNVPFIRKMLKKMNIEKLYIHADAALSGMILPFLNDPQLLNLFSETDSVSISGHKFIGSPIPCGIVLAKKDKVKHLFRAIEYIGGTDVTLFCSRNAIAPLFLWYAIKRYGISGFSGMVQACMETAERAVVILKENGIDAWKNKNSITVVFPKPSQHVLDKWRIAVYGDIAHLIIMNYVTIDIIKEFVKDIIASPALGVS